MRDKKKIIRAVTVSMSLTFCRDIMIKMRAMGYHMMAVTSPGPELDDLSDKDGFNCVGVPMLRRVSRQRCEVAHPDDSRVQKGAPMGGPLHDT